MKSFIWTYWHQGFDKAPDLVQRCVARWEELHPDWEFKKLDANNIHEYVEPITIPQEKLKKMKIAHRSDLIRTQLLIRYGGVWADPTIFPVRKLDDWLPAMMAAGLFMFQRPGRDRIIANWFIAAEKGNYLLQKLYNSLISYWNQHEFRNLGKDKDSIMENYCKRIIDGRSLALSQLWLSYLFTKVLKLYPYMVYHFMCYKLIKADVACEQIFEQMPKVNADGPHVLQREGLLQKLTSKAKSAIDNKSFPLFKLKWKLDVSEIPEDSNLYYLFRHSN